jgi:hypothetical protein
MIKNKLQNITAALLLSVALAAPAIVNAQDTTTSGTTAAASATPKAKKAPQPVTGKVASVDKTAKTFKVGTHTFTVSDATKWEGDLTLDTLKEGTRVTVAYTKDGETNNATDVKAAATTKTK